MRVSRLLPGLLAGVLMLGGVGAASAATARASAAITIYDGPGYYYAPIGKLASGEVVKLSECTPSGRWCRVVHDGPDVPRLVRRPHAQAQRRSGRLRRLRSGPRMTKWLCSMPRRKASR